jgi:hypothetical protein
MKNKNVILIPPNLAYGDCLSVIGLLYYLLEYYDNVYFYLGDSHSLLTYYYDYFNNDPLYGKRIFITPNPETLINDGEYGEYHICNTMTGDWSGPNTIFYDLKNIDRDYYFNDLNPLYNKIDIPEEYRCQPNKHLPNNDLEINHIFYYQMVGLNNKVRMDYFNYERDLESEKNIKNEILWRFGLGPNDKYNIINDPVGETDKVIPYINNDYKTLNINYLSVSPGRLLSLMEGSESIHFIEGCNVNFFYHCQFKKLFNYDKKINFYIWVRNRNWLYPKMNLDYAWKMMDDPKLSNWVFIFSKN